MAHMEPKELNMNYLFISKFCNTKTVYMTDDSFEIKPDLKFSKPKLMAVNEHNDIVLLTEDRLGKEVFDSLYCLSDANTEFTSPCFSFEKGKEDDLAFQLDAKYAFAYLDGTFKYFDRHAEKWRTVRYDFGDHKDQELAFKALAQKGSFVLRLDKIAIDWYFNANDVLNNN